LPHSSEFERLRVVLVAPRNPLNIGAAARAMSNFGFLQLRVVNPYEAAFREARSAVGASAVLARTEIYKTVNDAVTDCALVVGTTTARQRELEAPLLQVKDGARKIRGRLRSGGVALLFGSEKRGLSNLDLSHCHWLMRIPTREDHPSMNLGQAVAVCLYEVARETRPVAPKERVRLARSGEVERLTRLLFEALSASGYVNPPSAAIKEERLRQLVRRLRLSATDAPVWLGMLRQILWKLHAASGSPDTQQ